MIVEEYIGEKLVRHYSDEGFMIRQVETGAVYEDTVDPVPCRFTYEETGEPISGDEIVRDKAEAYDILMGVSE